MKLWIARPAINLGSKTNVEKIEQMKDATFMGSFCTKRPSGGWNELPVDVFYQPNPDISKGHSNYFGLFYQNDTLFITDGLSAFSEPIDGIVADGEVVVSRYRHDYQERGGGVMIDGGRDYTRSSGSGHRFVSVTVSGPKFLFDGVPEGEAE